MTRKLPIAFAAILIAVISFCIIAPAAGSPEKHTATINSIDSKIDTVMRLTAASTTSSALISAMPGDTATPISEKLADFSTYFLLVLCVLYLEKYLITVTGIAAFRVLIPIAALSLAAGYLWKKDGFNHLGKRLAIFAVAIFLLVPASVKVSDLIYNTYAASIESTIAAAEDDEIIPVDSDTGGIASWFVDRATNLTQTASGILNRFVEALAVMIVTCCLIPLLVLLFFLWLMKVILGIDIPVIIPRRGRISVE